MRRVVITGMGIISCIGNDLKSVSKNLRAGKSGITKNQTQSDMGFRSHVSGAPDIDIKDHFEKRDLRFMCNLSGWAALSLRQAITNSELEQQHVCNERTGIIAGSGGIATNVIYNANVTAKEKAIKRIGPFVVPKVMSSSVSATLSTLFKLRGMSYSISSACTTSLHCLGAASEQIAWGNQDIMFAGGSEELEWNMSCLFDAMGAMSSRYNEMPEQASRAFDAERDGFVISGGAGMLVLEEYEHAKKRGATIYGEITGYAATSDGHDMVAPNGEGAERAMRMALKSAGHGVDYINPHATSTPVGDMKESEAMARIFGETKTSPLISATKSMTGHAMGAAGVQEVIYSLLMMRDKFIAPSINIKNLDSALPKLNIVTSLQEIAIKSFMSNSFGFGGTNGSVIIRKV